MTAHLTDITCFIITVCLTVHFTVVSYVKQMLAIWPAVCKGLLTSVHLSRRSGDVCRTELIPFPRAMLGKHSSSAAE